MSIIEIILLAIALAMDCLAVSITCGIVERRWQSSIVLRTAFLFGFFQGMMPLIGWAMTTWFSAYIQSFDHWIAFGLLAFLGGKMVVESFSDDSAQQTTSSFSPQRLSTQLLLAVATSIDALAVGITFAAVGYSDLLSLALPTIIIGVVSFLFSLIGHRVGIRFGDAVKRRIKPTLLGGIILIAIGLRILVSHLMGE